MLGIAWDCTIQQLARLKNWPPLFSLVYTTQLRSGFFWPVNPYFLVFFKFIFPHTHHTTYSGIHGLLVTTQENERKVRKSLRKRRKTCVTIIVGNRTRNLSIGNRCTYRKERSYFDPSGRETSSKHSQTRSFTVGSQFHSHHEGTRRLQEFCRGKNKE